VFNGYMRVGGVEVFNAARTHAYVTAHLPGIDIRCNPDGLAEALGHSEYTNPQDDAAPWYQGSRPAAGRFYGLFPSDVQGADDSTRSMNLTELIGDGAVHTMPRHGSREIRVTATAIAADDEALAEGLAWLRDVLAGEGCADTSQLSCTGREVVMFTAKPESSIEEQNFRRYFHESEVTEGPLHTVTYPSKIGAMIGIEFTITSGKPWAFTPSQQVASLDMDAASNFQDPVGEDCSPVNAAYDSYIDDPFYTGIARPPAPPVILPPNILNITSWRRLTAIIPPQFTQRWGRTIPIVKASTGGTAAQYLRVRFYREGTGLDGCDYDGEFLVSYIPVACTLVLDAVHRTAEMHLPNGAVVPAGHLLFGSDGRPFQWPSLGCQYAYTMTADLMPGQPDVTVVLETAVRE
jgi:hypothetical protein